MSQITITNSNISMNKREFEIVERKSIGHPDTLADGVAEAISIEYSRYCLEQFSTVLHHNVDKIAFIGGEAKVNFGSGEMLAPIKLVLNGRMSNSFAEKPIDYIEIQKKAAKEYIQSVLPHFNVEEWLKFIALTNSFSHLSTWFRPMSLDDVPDHKQPHANDTACCIGYWPLSATEKLVIELDRCFYFKDGRSRFNFIGQDIKIMAVRRGYHIDIIMCIPFISLITPNLNFYREQLAEIKTMLLVKSREILGDDYNISLSINTTDGLLKDDYYLLLSGTALEGGEEGVVGRGNRINGLIPCIRPHTMEAPFGKNPNYHVGKVYGYLANQAAKAIAEELECECYVYIVTKIGESLRPPEHLIVELDQPRDSSIIKQILQREIFEADYLSALVRNQAISPRLWRQQS